MGMLLERLSKSMPSLLFGSLLGLLFGYIRTGEDYEKYAGDDSEEYAFKVLFSCVASHLAPLFPATFTQAAVKRSLYPSV